jgi:hypothetical protein
MEARKQHMPKFVHIGQICKICILLYVIGVARCNGQQAASNAHQRLLFLDPSVIEKSSGVVLRVNPPVRMEPIIVPDRPWEHLMITFYVSVIQEGGKIRLWYTCRDDENKANLAYAESEDGIHWVKPNLGIVDYHGSKENNLVGIHSLEGVVFKDPNAAPDRRYKYLTNSESGIVQYYSPDGLHWAHRDNSLIRFTSDTQNVSFWDNNLKKYVLYLRGWDLNPRRRKVVRLTVDGLDASLPIAANPNDFHPRNDPKAPPFISDEVPTVLHADAEDPARSDIYNISAELYPLDPTWYLGFPSFLRGKDQPDIPSRGFFHGPVEVDFAGSRDGIHWNRYDRAAYVSPGWFGNKAENVAYMGTGLAVMNDELWQYGTILRTEHGDVEGRRKQTDGEIVRFIQREDGFVSADASASGSLTTVPIAVTGKHLVLNLDTGALGQVQVGILGLNGEELPGFSLGESEPLQANSIGRAVSWTSQKDLSALVGQRVRLVFQLKRVKLYSIRFED